MFSPLRIPSVATTLLLAGSVYAYASTEEATTSATSDTQTVTATEELNDTISFPVWPTSTVELQDEEAVSVQFSLGSITGIDPTLLSGVTANGYTRKVDAEGESVGQVLITTVSKDGKEVALSSEGLTAQFDASETTSLFPQEDLEVEGSRAELIAALEALNGDGEEEEENAAPADTSVSDSGVSSDSSTNDEASSYTTPTTTTETEEDPVEDYRLTEDGCDVRVDFTQELAIQQNKTQTFLDNVLSSETDCADSGTSYTLKKSYLACEDIVDLDQMKAWAQFTWYYTDDAGETHTVSECTQDDDKEFEITEDEDQCTIEIDYTAKTATPQSALVYLDENNKLTIARDCQETVDAEVLTMTESTDACSMRHEYSEGLTYELSMWTYVRDGITYQAMPCTDTGRTFTHETVYYTEAGENVCTPVTDLTNNTVTFQSRKQITVDGVSEYITECTPDTSTSAIMSTTAGCLDASLWTHDIDASISYGQERFYYLKDGSTPVYVTSCQTSDVTYAHNHEITGYQHHDDQLYSYPLTTVSINVNGSTYNVATSEVLPGAAQFAYVQDGTTDVRNGEATYEGCNAYYLTDRSEKYERPDGTYYYKAIGDGDAQGPEDVCSEDIETATYVAFAQDPNGGWEAVTGTKSVSTTVTNIQRVVKTNTATGEVFYGSPSVTGTQTSTLYANKGTPACTGSNPYYKCETKENRSTEYGSIQPKQNCSGPWNGSRKCAYSPADAVNW